MTSMTTIDKVIEALGTGDKTVPQIADAIQMSRHPVRAALKYLKDKKLIRVGAYQYSGWNHVAIYALGAGADAQPKAKQSQAEKNARAREYRQKYKGMDKPAAPKWDGKPTMFGFWGI